MNEKRIKPPKNIGEPIDLGWGYMIVNYSIATTATDEEVQEVYQRILAMDDEEQKQINLRRFNRYMESRRKNHALVNRFRRDDSQSS